jgi:hypothetical protein
MRLNHPLYNQEKIQKLTPMQKRRLESQLGKYWRFDGVVRSMGQQLQMEFDNGELKDKYTTNNMWKWNRRKFNQMLGHEQKEYEARLIKGRTYHVTLNDERRDERHREIPKVIYDVLDLPDATDYETLNMGWKI